MSSVVRVFAPPPSGSPVDPPDTQWRTCNAWEKRTGRLRGLLRLMTWSIEEVPAQLGECHRLKDWRKFGYESWSDYCAYEFGQYMIKVPAPVRKQWTPELRRRGLSTAEIAAFCGVDRKTIQRDARPEPEALPAATDVAPQRGKLATIIEGRVEPEDGHAGQEVIDGIVRDVDRFAGLYDAAHCRELLSALRGPLARLGRAAANSSGG